MLSRTRRVGALAALSAAAFAYVTTETMPIGLLLPIAGDLRVTPAAVGQLVTGYGLVVVVATVPLTYATRRLPRRPLMTALLAVFTVATVLAALAPGYSALLATRVLTALSQSVFWAIVTPIAASLFPIAVRGRILAVVAGSGPLAAILGVPAGAWLGQHTGWRTVFLALAVLPALTVPAVALLLPAGSAAAPVGARGESPDPRRYALLLVTTVLGALGAFTAFTYVTPFLIETAGFSAAALGPLLLVRGLAGIAGLALGGWLTDRSPVAAMVVPAAIQAVSLLALFLVPGVPVLAVILVGAGGLALAALMTALGARVLQTAPGSQDLAGAGSSTAVNIGITGGALGGALTLSAFGVRSTALVAGVLSLAAVAAALSEPLLRSHPAARRARPGPTAGCPDTSSTPAARTGSAG
ncbi:MFS transporter [Actinoplanes sp. NPDC051851]|uniref:MFS transporter n=1 Tax=Actinoplanes sp. NPDC051851 TaxID=3154753 RepID=UPI003438385D